MKTIKIPTVLLPKKGTDMTAWAVNACDQFTSDAEYWRGVERLVGDKPSTLNLIYPEIYLKQDTQKRIAAINAKMEEYLADGIFQSAESLILVERTTQSGTRTGIVLAIDLEDYDFKAGASSPVRSTEATILERIPPRVQIRENAPLELPHVMLLYEDKENSVLKAVKRGERAYVFDLNMGGGSVAGTYIANPQEVVKSFYALPSAQTDAGLLFAVGDGNHSLATAKTCWEKIKQNLTEEERQNHPARFALAEAVNLFDEALTFEPIHRLVKTEYAQKFLQDFPAFSGGEAEICVNGKGQTVPFTADIPQGIRELDAYIADFIAQNGGEVDYIHGKEEVEKFSSQGVGIILPPIEKRDFFSLIIKGGNLPRKTFSMGEGNEKRYYIEAKLIRNR